MDLGTTYSCMSEIYLKNNLTINTTTEPHMPLKQSSSKAAVGKNIKTEMAAGKPRDQAIAIALDVQRRATGGHHRGPDKVRK